MSVNRYTTQSGLQTLANGKRCWIGTKEAHEAAKQAGTLPTDCLICITDDDDEFKTDQVIEDSQMVITSGGVYDALKQLRFNASSAFANLSDCYVDKGMISGLAYKTASDYPSGLTDSYCFVYYISAWSKYGIQLAVGQGNGKTYIRMLNNSTWTSWVAMN